MPGLRALGQQQQDSGLRRSALQLGGSFGCGGAPMAIPQHPFRADGVPTHQGAIPASPQELYMAMSSAFAEYSEIVELTAHDNETARTRLQLLESQCHGRGLCGQSIIQLLRAFHAQIGWERMVPDEFTRFYRFVFHLCKQPSRKHVQVDIALDAWRLLLALRFRLLDKWCDFISVHKPTLKVISEDQWRQVLEFSRTVHEDLSNYDPNGAWSCCLDDFVEHVRCYRPGAGSRSHSVEEELHMLNSHMDRNDTAMLIGVPMSPRLGSKRRSPDVDVVLERLSAIPLPSTAAEDPMGSSHHAGVFNHNNHTPGSASKRHCPDTTTFQHNHLIQQHQQEPQPQPQPQLQPQLLHPVDVPLGLMLQEPMQTMSCGSGVGGSMSAGAIGSSTAMSCALSPIDVPPHSPFTFELPMLQVNARRHIRPRRSNVSELVHHTVSELFLNE